MAMDTGLPAPEQPERRSMQPETDQHQPLPEPPGTAAHFWVGFTGFTGPSRAQTATADQYYQYYHQDSRLRPYASARNSGWWLGLVTKILALPVIVLLIALPSILRAHAGHGSSTSAPAQSSTAAVDADNPPSDVTSRLLIGGDAFAGAAVHLADGPSPYFVLDGVNRIWDVYCTDFRDQPNAKVMAWTVVEDPRTSSFLSQWWDRCGSHFELSGLSRSNALDGAIVQATLVDDNWGRHQVKFTLQHHTVNYGSTHGTVDC